MVVINAAACVCIRLGNQQLATSSSYFKLGPFMGSTKNYV